MATQTPTVDVPQSFPSAIADVDGLVAALAAKEATANKGTPSGYAGLGTDGYVVPAQLGAGNQLAGSRVAPASASAAGTMSAAHFSAVAALGTMSTQAASAVAITGGTATGLTQLATTAACTALLGGATASAQSSLAVLASKTIAVPAADSVWRGLDFQASTLTLTAGGVAPSSLSAAYFAAPVITSPAAYVVPVAATVTIAGPPTAGGALAITNAASLVVLTGNVGIGTTSPQAPLSIAGVGHAPGTSGTATYGLYTYYDTVSTLTIALGAQLVYPYGAWMQTYDPAAGGMYPICLNPRGGGVAIGALNPGAMSELYVVTTNPLKSITSAAGAVWDGIKFAASTVNITGATGITALAFHKIEAPTISGDTAGLVISTVATLTITGPPVAGNANTTITTPLALHIEGGNVLCGTGTPDGTATPFHMSFGATYGTNAPGSPGNLKWMLYEGGGHYYGIGMSAGLMEIQADAGAAVVFFQGGSEIVRVTNNVQITSLAGTGSRTVVADANGVLSAP